MEPLSGLHSNGRPLALPTNIRLGWKQMEVANTLAYYDTTIIMDVKVLYYRHLVSKKKYTPVAVAV